jgi:RNA polymerase sigma-70 factor (ECF subfamily)
MEALNFEQLVDRHHAGLYRFALSLAREEAEAVELVQQTFYLWAKKGHQLRDASKAKAWLFTTLHREFLGAQRRLIRFPHDDISGMESELPAPAPAAGARLDEASALGALAILEETFRGPVALFYLEDYSYVEIGEILGIPLGTVKSRISRGIAQLQRHLSDLSPRSKDSNG